jgi:hypothetical protein
LENACPRRLSETPLSVLFFFFYTSFDKIIYPSYQDWEDKPRKRPILTGAYLCPSLFNRPLPRLKPQPVAISMMIYKRHAARERRPAKSLKLHEWRDDLRRERAFENNLGKSVHEPVYENNDAWGACGHFIFFQITTTNSPNERSDQPMCAMHHNLKQTFTLDVSRYQTPYPPQLLQAIKQARCDKIANKTREHERERK